MRQNARPIAFVMLVGALCILAGLETAYSLSAPQWFLGFAIAMSSEWLLERAYRKFKGDE